MTKSQNKFLWTIVVGVFVISSGIFMIPNLLPSSDYADIKLSLNGDNYNFNIEHSFLDPIIFTLFIWLVAGFYIRASSATVKYLMLFVVFVGITGLLYFLYELEPSICFDFLLASGIILRYGLLWLAKACLVGITIYSIWYTWEHKWSHAPKD